MGFRMFNVMLRVVFIMLFLTSIFFIKSCSFADDTLSGAHKVEKGEFREGELIVRFREDVGEDEIKRIIERKGAAIIKTLSKRTYLLRLPPDMKVSQAVDLFNGLKEVEYAEPNYIRKAFERD